MCVLTSPHRRRSAQCRSSHITHTDVVPSLSDLRAANASLQQSDDRRATGTHAREVANACPELVGNFGW